MYLQNRFCSNGAAQRIGRSERHNPLIDKLSAFGALNAIEKNALELMSRNRKILSANQIVIHEGNKSNFAIAVMAGVAFRFKYLANGRRQIFGYLLPGDLCDSHYVLANRADHSVGLLTDAELAIIPTGELMAGMVDYPNIARALRQSSMLEESVLREWLLNIGQRGALQRLAHFLCEIAARFDALGMIEQNGSFAIPLTQCELADTMGLTAVHVNRCMQRLRESGLVHWNRRRLSIVDRAGLIELAEFDGRYLRPAPMTTPLPATPEPCAMPAVFVANAA